MGTEALRTLPCQNLGCAGDPEEERPLWEGRSQVQVRKMGGETDSQTESNRRREAKKASERKTDPHAEEETFAHSKTRGKQRQMRGRTAK